jgi:hypothetical protein
VILSITRFILVQVSTEYTRRAILYTIHSSVHSRIIPGKALLEYFEITCCDKGIMIVIILLHLQMWVHTTCTRTCAGHW